MANRGRPPKAADLHVLEGTFREDRHGGGVDAGGVPKRPATLKGEARKFWDSVVPGLATAGVARERDTSTLVVLCEWWGRYRAWSKKLDGLPVSEQVEARGVALQVDLAWGNFDRLACRFGLTPADRVRLREQPQKRAGVEARKRG